MGWGRCSFTGALLGRMRRRREFSRLKKTEESQMNIKKPLKRNYHDDFVSFFAVAVVNKDKLLGVQPNDDNGCGLPG